MEQEWQQNLLARISVGGPIQRYAAFAFQRARIRSVSTEFLCSEIVELNVERFAFKGNYGVGVPILGLSSSLIDAG